MKKIFSAILIFLPIISISSIQKAEASSQVFTDLPKSHPNYAAIMYLADQGVITKQKRFGPNDKVTREEVAIMVAKATGLDGKKTKTKFKDVPASRYSSGYINSAVNARIINGYPDGTFKPTQFVTRGHMAAFIANAFKLTKEENVQFKDVAKGSTSYNAVRKLAANNITSGYPDGTFKPNQTLTRSHIAAFIARAMEPNFRPIKKDFVTRRVYFDMTMKQVLESENMKPKEIIKSKEFGSDFLIYEFDSHILGYKTELTYSFDNDKLSQIVMVNLHEHQSYISPDRLREIHNQTVKKLTKEHGNITYEDHEHDKIATRWVRKGYDVFLLTKFEYNYPIRFPESWVGYFPT